MRKLKVGFSTLMTFVLVGLFSIVAFAAVPVGPTVTQTVTGQDVTLSWTAVAGANSYNVYWDGSSTAENQTGLTYTKTGLTYGTTYTAKVESVNTDGVSAPKLVTIKILPSVPTGVTKSVNGSNVTFNWAAAAGATSYNVYWNGSTTAENQTTQTYTKTGLADGTYTIAIESVNGTLTSKSLYTAQVKTPAPKTGTASPTKGNPADGIHVGTVDNAGKDSQQRTHGNFQNNTNSCANCHSTHNGEAAADGTNNFLLMKGGEFDLCMSCHDGTMGFYNVQGAYDGATAASVSQAGTFDFDNSHLSASMHNVNSAVKVNSAPGAFKNGSLDTFECSSCHNPHGSVNDRLLNEKVAGSQFAYNYTSAPTGYQGSLVYTKSTPIPLKTKAINLSLSDDPAYVDINNYAGTSGLRITKSNGPTADTDILNMSNFCAGCHDDYLKSASEQRADGHFTHTTTEVKGGRNCESCHYAHGTNINILKDTSGRTIADLKAADPAKWGGGVAENYMKDISVKGSSLKKFTNMAVCWSCHQSSHAIDTNTPADYNGAGKPTK